MLGDVTDLSVFIAIGTNICAYGNWILAYPC